MATIDELDTLAREKKHEGNYEEAFQLRLQLESLIGDDLDQHARNYNWLAYLGVHIGRFEVAERAARTGLSMYQQLTAGPDARLATYTSMLAAVLASAGKYAEAIHYGDLSIELYAETGHDAKYVAECRADFDRMRNREPGIYLDRS